MSLASALEVRREPGGQPQHCLAACARIAEGGHDRADSSVETPQTTPAPTGCRAKNTCTRGDGSVPPKRSSRRRNAHRNLSLPNIPLPQHRPTCNLSYKRSRRPCDKLPQLRGHAPCRRGRLRGRAEKQPASTAVGVGQPRPTVMLMAEARRGNVTGNGRRSPSQLRSHSARSTEIGPNQQTWTACWGPKRCQPLPQGG